jgi:hypothetical protein
MIYQDKNYIKFQAEHEKADIIKAGGMPLLFRDGKAFTPYPYGGPSENFSYGEFINDLKNVGANRYFIRFAPWLENHIYFPANEVKYSRQTIARNLTKSVKFGHGVKWSIKKSRESKVFISYSVFNLSGFMRLYERSMKEKNADNKYCFDLNKFKYHLWDNIGIFAARYKNEMIAGALFLEDKDCIHYHLSAMNKEYNKFFPMEQILYEACCFYQRAGSKLIHFGGGLREGDSLFQFKQKFGNLTFDYFVADGNT